jgi:hypothetical protein
LNPQEIRNIAFNGTTNDLIYKLADHQFLRKQLKIIDKRSAAYRSMQDAEFVLRFLTLHGNEGMFRGSLLRSMDDFMLHHRRAPPAYLKHISDIYVGALERCEAIWGSLAFRRPEGGGWRDQTLAGMYDAEMIAVSRLSSREAKAAIAVCKDILGRTKKLFENPDFDKAVRQGTNTPSRLSFRVDTVHEMILAAL